MGGAHHLKAHDVRSIREGSLEGVPLSGLRGNESQRIAKRLAVELPISPTLRLTELTIPVDLRRSDDRGRVSPLEPSDLMVEPGIGPPGRKPLPGVAVVQIPTRRPGGERTGQRGRIGEDVATTGGDDSE